MHAFHQQTVQAVNAVLDSFGTRLNLVLPKDGSERMTGPLQLAQFTVATKPAAASWVGSVIEVTDAPAGQEFQYSDGTTWKPIPRFTGSFTSGHLVGIAADGSLQDSGGTGNPGTVTSVSDATNGGISVTNPTTTPALALNPSDLLTKATPTTADSLVLMDVAASNAPKTALISALPALPGTWTAGSSVTKNPIATASLTSGAHNLSRVDEVLAFLINLTAEQGYGVGEKISLTAIGDTQGTTTVAISADATNVYITINALPVLPSKSSLGTGFVITAANWKVVATPYKIN